MNVHALSWFEDDDPRELRRWIIAAAIVVAVHLAAVASYVFLHVPDEIGDDTAPVSIELAPIDSDIDQPEIAATPQPEQQKPIEQPPPPPPPDAVAMPEEKPVEQPQEVKPQAAPTPAMTKGGAPAVSPSWASDVVKHLQRYKRYPSAAQTHREQGVALLGFSVDRTGHVLARHIVRSSGHADLDAEVIAMIERAQPLPPFPATMTQDRLDLTVPVGFTLR
jgi:periplasmic protein TonB